MNGIILTERNYQKWASFHNVYEWEDVFSEKLDIPVRNFYDGILSKECRLFRKGIYKQNIIKPKFSYKCNSTLKFKWIISAKGYREFTGTNVIPIFIDFPLDMVREIIIATEELPFFFVSMIDVKNELEKNGCKNVYYMPMSIADKWYEKICPHKEIDVIQVGRRNDKLHGFMMDYVKRQKEVDYVFVANSNFEYYSTKKKTIIGKVDSREEFMKLLGRSKISLVSTPGADGISRFGKMDFVPVRFYECASRYCHMVGRFSYNEEIRKLGIGTICTNVRSQEDFDNAITELLGIECKENIVKYDDFLKANVTSRRVETFVGIVK